MTSPTDEPDKTAGGHHARDADSVCVAVVTVSDTRTAGDDFSGDELVRLLVDAGHRLVDRCRERDDPEALAARLRQLLGREPIEAVVLTGGTGIAPRDVTPEVVRALLDVELPGFGEAFREISRAEIGPKAMLSRAVAGRAGETLLFALPGSRAAVTTAMTRCVLPILPHAVALARPNR